MRERFFIPVFILMTLAMLFTGCSQGDTPKEIYWQYYAACKEGRFDDASQKLAEGTLRTPNILGVCAFTHDAVNTIEAQKGNPPRTFSNDPKIVLTDEMASLTWIDDQGNIVTVTLILEEGDWKITEVIWSY